MEFSKKLVIWVLIFCFAVIAFCCYMIYVTEDLTPVSELIILVSGIVMAVIGFYENKAKAENKIKLMKENNIKITGEHFKEE